MGEYPEFVERYPELKRIWKFANETSKKYEKTFPELASDIREWRNMTFRVSLHSRACDYDYLMKDVTEIGKAHRKVTERAVSGMFTGKLTPFERDSLEKELEDHESTFYTEIQNILRKVCSCKPTEWPPVEGPI
jgi:NAD-dependent DNA ligase